MIGGWRTGLARRPEVRAACRFRAASGAFSKGGWRAGSPPPAGTAPRACVRDHQHHRSHRGRRRAPPRPRPPRASRSAPARAGTRPPGIGRGGPVAFAAARASPACMPPSSPRTTTDRRPREPGRRGGAPGSSAEPEYCRAGVDTGPVADRVPMRATPWAAQRACPLGPGPRMGPECAQCAQGIFLWMEPLPSLFTKVNSPGLAASMWPMLCSSQKRRPQYLHVCTGTPGTATRSEGGGGARFVGAGRRAHACDVGPCAHAWPAAWHWGGATDTCTRGRADGPRADRPRALARGGTSAHGRKHGPKFGRVTRAPPHRRHQHSPTAPPPPTAARPNATTPTAASLLRVRLPAWGGQYSGGTPYPGRTVSGRTCTSWGLAVLSVMYSSGCPSAPPPERARARGGRVRQ